MAYYYTAEPENAVQGNSCASPKLHGGPKTDWVLSTKYTDSETGFLFYGHRFYNPEIGRWASRDPIGEEGGYNLTVFAQNDPGDRTDSWGLFSLPKFPNPLHLTKSDANPGMCARVKSLMGFWALGPNQTLWDWWLNAPPSSQTKNGVTDVPYDWFDSGNDSSPAVDAGINLGLAHAKKLKCSGKGSMKWHRTLNPQSHTLMISWYTLKVDCDLNWEAVWDPNCCKCKSVSAKADCNLNANDKVDFWDDPKKGFWLPPYYVDDQFILACNYGGKGFSISAKGNVAKDTGPRDCRFSSLPPLPF